MANRYGTQSYGRGGNRRNEQDYRSRDYDRDRYGNRDTERERYGSDYAGYGRGSGYGHEEESRYLGGSYGRGSGSYNRDYDEDTITGAYSGGRDYDRERYGNRGGYGSNYERGESRGGYAGGRRDYSDYNRGGREGDRERYGDRYNEEDRTWLDRAGDEVASWFGDEEAERRRQMDARQQGQHRGRGPRNYKRSDDRIKEDINDRLTDHDYLDASDIDVEVNNGDVILTGTVDSRAAKRMAEDIAEGVTGVGNVENRIRVKQNSYGQGNWSTTGTTSDTSTTTGTTGTTGTTDTTTETTTTGKSRSRAV